jgi:hypothetical protein
MYRLNRVRMIPMLAIELTRRRARGFKAIDRKKAEEAAALASRSIFDKGTDALPQAGISGVTFRPVGRTPSHDGSPKVSRSKPNLES